MDFFKILDEQRKGKNFFFSLITSIIIVLAGAIENSTVREKLVYFTPQISEIIIFLILLLIYFVKKKSKERRDRINSSESLTIAKDTMSLYQAAKQNGLAEEDITALSKITKETISSHMKLNLSRLEQLNKENQESMEKQNQESKEIEKKVNKLFNNMNQEES
ncbi:hypothetical protein [Pectobacterium sp. CHL-2024]|uniref:hypothetical protein n=1 Tax=Pectobacterium sp. CHL-2024 TaxID=3377079 RepID=UPI0037F724D1